MPRDAIISRWAACAVVLAVLVAGACDSGAVEGPDDDSEAANEQADDGGGEADERDRGGGGGGDGGGDTGGSSGGGNGGGDTGGSSGGGNGGGDGGGFSWGLPVGDISPDGSTDLYYALRSSCDEGATALEAELARAPNVLFPPELLKLYEAAVAVCRGDVERGRELYAEGAGDGGYGHGCLVREAVLSVLEQRAQNIRACRYTTSGETTGEEGTPSTEGEATTSTEGEATTTTSSTGGGSPETGGDDDDGG